MTCYLNICEKNVGIAADKNHAGINRIEYYVFIVATLLYICAYAVISILIKKPLGLYGFALDFNRVKICRIVPDLLAEVSNFTFACLRKKINDSIIC